MKDGYTIDALNMVLGLGLIGEDKYSFNPKDWALAALSIYMCIISILILVGVYVTG